MDHDDDDCEDNYCHLYWVLGVLENPLLHLVGEFLEVGGGGDAQCRPVVSRCDERTWNSGHRSLGELGDLERDLGLEVLRTVATVGCLIGEGGSGRVT